MVLSDQALSENLQSLVRQERKITAQVLSHLEEVERRKLYAKRGYSSLFAYCTEELGYSASAAQRRIVSMRLAKQVPEVKGKLQSGELNLTTLAMAGSFFNQESKQEKVYSVPAKAALLEELQNKSTKEVEKKLVQISPKSVLRPERLRSLSEELTEVKLTFNQQQMAKLRRLRELGVSRGKFSTSELLDWAMDLALAHTDPMQKAERAKRRLEKKAATSLKADQATKLEQGAKEDLLPLWQWEPRSPSSAVPPKSKGATNQSKSLPLRQWSQTNQPIPARTDSTVIAKTPNSLQTQQPEPTAPPIVEPSKANGPMSPSDSLPLRQCKPTARPTSKSSTLPKGSSLPTNSLPLRQPSYQSQQGPVSPPMNTGIERRSSLGSACQRPRRTPIPAAVRHQVYLRDRGCCTYKDPLTGKACGSTQSLELDHIQPWSLGGEDSVENLRLLCRAHNQVRIQKLGVSYRLLDGLSE